MSEDRVGIGFDVHQLVEGRPLVLGGVSVEYEKGLLGHSDADVLTHAVMDAICGALGLGDIGQLYPDTDPQFKDISSLLLLEDLYVKMRQRGYLVGNIDTILCAQEPKIAPLVAEMEDKLAKALVCNSSKINVKATTTEHLGFVGRKEGMAAYAIVRLVPIDSYR